MVVLVFVVDVPFDVEVVLDLEKSSSLGLAGVDVDRFVFVVVVIILADLELGEVGSDFDIFPGSPDESPPDKSPSNSGSLPSGDGCADFLSFVFPRLLGEVFMVPTGSANFITVFLGESGDFLGEIFGERRGETLGDLLGEAVTIGATEETGEVFLGDCLGESSFCSFF